MNKREIGTFYERQAEEFLKDKGVHILEQNYRCRQGEIDIIGYDGTCLVFFEVKGRKSLRAGSGLEAIHPYKQYKICRVADYYRMMHNISEFTEIRYDCIAIDLGDIHWIKNAFYHVHS